MGRRKEIDKTEMENRKGKSQKQKVADEKGGRVETKILDEKGRRGKTEDGWRIPTKISWKRTLMFCLAVVDLLYVHTHIHPQRDTHTVVNVSPYVCAHGDNNTEAFLASFSSLFKTFMKQI